MPSIGENSQEWAGSYSWSQEGDEWSGWWGSAHAQWFGCLLPRVFPFLKGRILEIAPGHGRWTQFLQTHCVSLIGIDLAQACIELCNQRFGQFPSLEFKVNDGLTFPMIEDKSIDFAFSFDSLVHAESDVMSSYTKELARVLKPGAVAFLHHSNLDAVRRATLFKRRISTHWRASSMSAEKMRGFVVEAGMNCVQQEIIPWGPSSSLWMIDCMSTIVNAPGSHCHVFKNRRFMQEAAAIKRISSIQTTAIQENAKQSLKT
jgi:SAM-dependent methyltransferase